MYYVKKSKEGGLPPSVYSLGSIGLSAGHPEQPHPQSHPQEHFPLRLSFAMVYTAKATAASMIATTTNDPADIRITPRSPLPSP